MSTLFICGGSSDDKSRARSVTLGKPMNEEDEEEEEGTGGAGKEAGQQEGLSYCGTVLAMPNKIHTH